MENFNVKKFITEVQKRPALWDSNCPDYMKREIKEKCWEELTDIFSDQEISEIQRKEVELTVKRKWKSLRDCFTRETNRLRKVSTTNRGRRKSTYVYYKRLQFLQGSQNKLDDIKDCSDSDDEAVHALKELKKPHETLKRRQSAPVAAQKKLSTVQESDILVEDEDRLFLLSLLKPLKKVPEEKRFSTKIQLMKVIEQACIDSSLPQYYPLAGFEEECASSSTQIVKEDPFNSFEKV